MIDINSQRSYLHRLRVELLSYNEKEQQSHRTQIAVLQERNRMIQKQQTDALQRLPSTGRRKPKKPNESFDVDDIRTRQMMQIDVAQRKRNPSTDPLPLQATPITDPALNNTAHITNAMIPLSGYQHVYKYFDRQFQFVSLSAVLQHVAQAIEQYVCIYDHLPNIVRMSEKIAPYYLMASKQDMETQIEEDSTLSVNTVVCLG